MPGLLPLPPSRHTQVFRELVRQIQADARLFSVIRIWHAWEGKPTDLHEISVAQCPGIILTPAEGPDSFYGPSGFKGTLVVTVGLAVAGTNADDLLNLYGAVRRALYPLLPTGGTDEAKRLGYRQALLALGATTGEPVLNSPRMGIATDGDNGPMLWGLGQILLEIHTTDP